MQARGDADVMIAKTAVETSRSMDTVLIGDDTDMLVLLLHHCDLLGKALYFRPEPKPKSIKNRTWNIKKSVQKRGESIAQNYYSFIPSLNVTPHPGSMALVNL